MTEEGNLATSKFMYPTELAYSHSRIHDPFKYRHFHDEDELLKLLNKYLKTNRKIESKGITILESYSYLEKYEDSLSFCRNRLKDIRFLIEIIGFNLTRYFQADEISDDDTISRKMSTLQSGNTEEHQTNCSSEEEKFDYNTFYETWNEEFKDGILDTEEKLEIIKSDFYYLDTDLLRQYLEGSVLVNVSAVTTVLLAIDKIFDQLNTQIAIFEEKDTREQLKCVFSYILKFSSLFDFLYGAMKVTPKGEFYKSKEGTKISNQLEVVDVDDAEEYWRNISKAFEEVGRVIAVATRGLKNKGIFRKIISFAGWMPYYFLFSKQKGAEQGLFFMNALNKSLLQKMSKIYETSAFKTYLRYSSPNVEIESKIFIEMSIPDALYEGDNLNSKEIPSMVKHDLDLPFRINMKDYDKNKFIKMRIISQNDWGTIDWKTGQLIDPDGEGVKLPVAVIFLHGGGFVFGSSGTYQYIIRKYAVETGYPIFAIDYRLAPEFKFPTQTNDCFQAYLWVRYYSEKYLKVKFDKIILLGDSAGGGLSFSLGSTAIRKRGITPDGMVLAYPGFCVDRTNFTPSLLLSADEPYLNVFFVDFCLSSYITDEGISSNYLASPQNTPK